MVSGAIPLRSGAWTVNPSVRDASPCPSHAGVADDLSGLNSAAISNAAAPAWAILISRTSLPWMSFRDHNRLATSHGALAPGLLPRGRLALCATRALPIPPAALSDTRKLLASGIGG